MFYKKTLKHLVILSCIAAVTFPLINIYLILPHFKGVLIERLEGDSVRFAKHFSRMVDPGLFDLESASLPEELIEEAEKIKSDFSLMKINIFSKSGEVIYSTDQQDIGEINTKTYFHDLINNGTVFSKVIEKEMSVMEKDGVKVIMTTALDDPKTVVESYYKLGATSYIVKPIGKQKLLQEVEKLGLIGLTSKR